MEENGGAKGRLLTVGELAEKLAVPKSWVYTKAEQGRLPVIRCGRYLRFHLPQVLQALQKGGV